MRPASKDAAVATRSREKIDLRARVDCGPWIVDPSERRWAPRIDMAPQRGGWTWILMASELRRSPRLVDVTTLEAHAGIAMHTEWQGSPFTVLAEHVRHLRVVV